MADYKGFCDPSSIQVSPLIRIDGYSETLGILKSAIVTPYSKAVLKSASGVSKRKVIKIHILFL